MLPTLQSLFFPRSVAVIGASRRPLTIGYRLIKNLIDFGYTGAIYPVNPKGGIVKNFRAYPSILEIPDEVDLAHIVIPAKFVPQAVEDCGKKGVKVVIINSAGFKEVGEEGAKLERQVVEVAKRYGVRVFGPNCQGIINTDPESRAYCNFTFTYPLEGNISIIAQSGGVGEVINQRLNELGVGVRFYASNGNAADISIPEIIKNYAADEKTAVIIVHIENLADPKEFYEVVSNVTPQKPVLAMKTGRTEEGSRAVASHTGGMVGADIATEVLLRKAGCVVFRDQEELCQAAIAFSMQPVPKGDRVGMITNTGGPAIIATDEVIEAGLSMPPLSDDSIKRLKEALHPAAVAANPIDVLATGTPEHWETAVDVLINDKNIDSILITFVTPFFVDTVGCARKFAAKVEEARKAGKPLIMNVMTDRRQWKETLSIIHKAGIPEYEFAETAARALVALCRYGQIRRRETEPPKQFDDVNSDAVKEVLDAAANRGAKHLSQAETFRLLEAYRIPCARWVTVQAEEQLTSAAEKVGFPAVLKVDDPIRALHKSEVGAVVLGIKDEEELLDAARRLWHHFEGAPLLLQEMVEADREVIIGAAKQPNMGHLILFGLGGIVVELLKDVAMELTPVSRGEAKAMLRAIKSAPLLFGFRNIKAADTETLAELVERVSRLVETFPQISELDINPLKVSAAPAVPLAVDARVILE